MHANLKKIANLENLNLEFTIMRPWPASIIGGGGSTRHSHSNNSIFCGTSLSSPSVGGRRMTGLDAKSSICRHFILPMRHGSLSRWLPAESSSLTKEIKSNRRKSIILTTEFRNVYQLK